MLSGLPSLLPAANRTEAYQIAAGLAMRFPELVFHNPEKLEQAWEMRRQSGVSSSTSLSRI